MILCVGTTDPITAHFKFTAWLHSTQIICYIVPSVESIKTVFNMFQTAISDDLPLDYSIE